ncbi:MAG: aldo/keto reductase [Bryobacteraceae bacterium]|nr:aldo/keto reductase [Bryobacteraceae bacterium]
MHNPSRRHFLRLGAAAVAAASLPAYAAKRSATDLVTLGRTGVKVCRLAFGTGTFGGRVQRELGQDQFTRLVRYAYDQGIRFFETAESYQGMPQMLAIALKGIPRDSYQLMTKHRIREGVDPKAAVERFRSDLNTDYFDILLMHCMRSPRWPDETKRVQDAFSEAKQKKMVLAHGASVHGLPALAPFPSMTDWLDVTLMRVNHNGARMDTPHQQESPERGDVNQVFATAQKLHKAGTGILGMKLIGEGQFTNIEDREAAMKYVLKSGCVDAMTIGYKNTAEIDESMKRVNRLLNA